jgi:hypothetical protein
MTLGMPYVEFTVPPGSAKGVGRFYEEIMGAPSTMIECNGKPAAKVRIGGNQLSFIFRETNDPIPAYDGHHVAIYISDFGTPYKKLQDLGLLSMENGPYEWRFKEIVDLDTKKVLFEIEHEVRSMTNPLYMRPLVNRNANQQQRRIEGRRQKAPLSAPGRCPATAPPPERQPGQAPARSARSSGGGELRTGPTTRPGPPWPPPSPPR